MLYTFDETGLRHIRSEQEGQQDVGLCGTQGGFPEGTLFLPHSVIHEQCVLIAMYGGSGVPPEPVVVDPVDPEEPVEPEPTPTDSIFGAPFTVPFTVEDQ